LRIFLRGSWTASLLTSHRHNFQPTAPAQQFKSSQQIPPIHPAPPSAGLEPCPNSKRPSPASRKSSPHQPLQTSALTPPRIAEGQFYEAHQQLRVIAARYAKQNNAAAQIDVLARGARLLLDAGQGGSGGDLCLALLDAYAKAGVEPDAESKARVLALLRAFPRGEPTRRRFVAEMVAWSARAGPFPAGDPELHHVAGTLYAEGKRPPWHQCVAAG
jgi:hypothetical protein